MGEHCSKVQLCHYKPLVNLDDWLSHPGMLEKIVSQFHIHLQDIGRQRDLMVWRLLRRFSNSFEIFHSHLHVFRFMMPKHVFPEMSLVLENSDSGSPEVPDKCLNSTSWICINPEIRLRSHTFL